MKRNRLLPLGVAICLLLAGGRNVEFYEKAEFSRSIMSFDEGPAEAHFLQKCFYSIEGAAGGLGTSAGGGCGCY